MAEEASECWSKEDLDAVIARSTKPKAAIQELITLTKSAVQKLKNSVTSARTELANLAKKTLEQQRKSAKARPGAAVTSIALHDAGAQHAKAVEALRVEAWSSCSFVPATPCLVSLSKSPPMFAPESELRKQVDMFTAKFEKAQRGKLEKGGKSVGDFRAQRSMPQQPATFVMDFIRGLVDPELIVPSDQLPPKVVEVLLPTVYGIECDYSQGSFERDHLATFRVCYAGTRSVVLADTVSVSHFLRDMPDEKAPSTLGGVASRFHKFSADDVKAFCKRFPLFFVTVAPEEMLYVPAGFMVSEVVGAAKDTFGVRCSLLLNCDRKPLLDMATEITMLTGKRPAIAETVDGLKAGSVAKAQDGNAEEAPNVKEASADAAAQEKSDEEQANAAAQKRLDEERAKAAGAVADPANKGGCRDGADAATVGEGAADPREKGFENLVDGIAKAPEQETEDDKKAAMLAAREEKKDDDEESGDEKEAPAKRSRPR